MTSKPIHRPLCLAQMCCQFFRGFTCPHATHFNSLKLRQSEIPQHAMVSGMVSVVTSDVRTVSTLLAVSEAEHVGTAEYHPAAGLICYVDMVLT